MREKLTPEQRYYRDAQFKTLVDMMYIQIEQSQFTPTELREGVILACTMYEMRHCRGMFIVPKEKYEDEREIKSP